MRRYDCTDDTVRPDGISAATDAARRGDLVVLPTDTVYGVGADAFSPNAVRRLLDAKGRGRDVPVPVLVGSWRTVNGLVDELPDVARDLIAAFWPGPLTLVLRQGAGLSWDLGDTKGTVAVRMPLHQVALDLLVETGPLAVSSANRHGQPPPTTVGEAEAQLGESVAVYLDGGPAEEGTPSTIVDLTAPAPRVLRAGALGTDRLREVVPALETP
ncbi:MAG TPA: L-threonylcarbamoyladenylate synthase [Frankiaceae bacterium]|jgi:tRNA threonylcarbamoyl adenosine modification protein (Sua5/YciO/YrdC/YwlC family)|nr:L-threonylcarbamoyladenylate synthase [Frankiaceae bacterium]